MDIAEFLLARIAEDEAASHDYWCSSSQIADAACDCPRKRVLAECAAKRRIVEWVENVQRYTADGDPQAFHDEEARALTFALRALALPYADHPDYDHRGWSI